MSAWPELRRTVQQTARNTATSTSQVSTKRTTAGNTGGNSHAAANAAMQPAAKPRCLSMGPRIVSTRINRPPDSLGRQCYTMAPKPRQGRAVNSRMRNLLILGVVILGMGWFALGVVHREFAMPPGDCTELENIHIDSADYDANAAL